MQQGCICGTTWWWQTTWQPSHNNTLLPYLLRPYMVLPYHRLPYVAVITYLAHILCSVGILSIEGYWHWHLRFQFGSIAVKIEPQTRWMLRPQRMVKYSGDDCLQQARSGAQAFMPPCRGLRPTVARLPLNSLVFLIFDTISNLAAFSQFSSSAICFN